MKTLFSFFILILLFGDLYGQCLPVNQFIIDNYTDDAAVLALREMNTPGHPEEDNPYVPQALLDHHLKNFSTIYENISSNAVADSIYNYWKFEVQKDVPFKKITLKPIDYNAQWVTDFINTGTSGIPAFDNLISSYNFNYHSSFVSIGVMDIETTHDFFKC